MNKDKEMETSSKIPILVDRYLLPVLEYTMQIRKS
jgi:hypothetical protein